MDPMMQQLMQSQYQDARRQRVDEQMKQMMIEQLLQRIMGGAMPAQGAGIPPDQISFQPSGGPNTVMQMLREYVAAQQGR